MKVERIMLLDFVQVLMRKLYVSPNYCKQIIGIIIPMPIKIFDYYGHINLQDNLLGKLENQLKCQEFKERIERF